MRKHFCEGVLRINTKDFRDPTVARSRHKTILLVVVLSLAAVVSAIPLFTTVAHADTIIGTISLGQGSSPGDVAVNPNTNTIYVADFSHSLVYIVDGATSSLVTTIPVPSNYIN